MVLRGALGGGGHMILGPGPEASVSSSPRLLSIS